MNQITIDFETYYDKDYSLSKITTEEYVRSPLFEVIGVAVQLNDEEPQWASGTHEQLRRWLLKFPWATSAVLAHNTMFDGAILAWVFGIYPAMWLDTLSMSTALNGSMGGNSLSANAERYGVGVKGEEREKAIGKHRLDFTPEGLSVYGDYCINDVRLTANVFTKMLEQDYPSKELKIIDLTLRMFIEPVLRVDAPYLEQYLLELSTTKEKLLADCGVDKSTLMSNPKFATALESLGVEPPMKISKTTGKLTYAFAKTDDGMKELQEHDDLRVQVLVGTRLGTKSTIEESRAQRFLDISKRGPLPIPLRYYSAKTGRWGGSDKINMQNLPKHGPNGKKLRRALLAPEGYTIIDSDSSQIEARTIAWWAGEQWLVDAFRNGEDVYVKMASAIYNVSEAEVTKVQRQVGKAAILGCGFGMSWQKFIIQAKNFGVSIGEVEAQRIVGIYRETHLRIVALWQQGNFALHALMTGSTTDLGRPGVVSLVPEAQAVRLPSGLLMRYEGLVKSSVSREYSYLTGKKRNRIYGASLVQNCVQALARVVMTDQMLQISKRYPIVLTVHDAVTVVVPDEEVPQAKAYMRQCMTTTPKWAVGLPVACRVETGKNYADLKE